MGGGVFGQNLIDALIWQKGKEERKEKRRKKNAGKAHHFFFPKLEGKFFAPNFSLKLPSYI